MAVWLGACGNTHQMPAAPLQAVRTPLEHAGPEQQLVDSLLPMWEEERARCGGSIPPRPPSPPRTPRPLCPAVEALRAELQVRGMAAVVSCNACAALVSVGCKVTYW